MPTSILIVEDNEFLRHSLSQLCLQHAFLTKTARTPAEAIQHLQHHSYDLILLDNHFPTATGYDLLEYLQQTDSHSKVLMISQFCQCTERVKALRSGVDDFIAKLFYPEELLVKIEKLILHKHDISDPWITTKHFKMNAYSGDVWQGNRKIILRRKEFEILALLIKYKNMVLTKDVIVEHVWNTDTMPMRTTVDVHVRRIRLQIKDSKKTVIKTVYGVGYQFCE